MVKCTKASTPDVYITAITPKQGYDNPSSWRQHSRRQAVTRRLHLLSRQMGNAPFSGQAELTELPDEPKSKSKSKSKSKKPKEETDDY
jgi:hypothetical protein